MPKSEEKHNKTKKKQPKSPRRKRLFSKPLVSLKNLYNCAKMPKIYWENNSEHIMTLINLPKETTERIKKQLE